MSRKVYPDIPNDNALLTALQNNDGPGSGLDSSGIDNTSHEEYLDSNTSLSEYYIDDYILPTPTIHITEHPYHYSAIALLNTNTAVTQLLGNRATITWEVYQDQNLTNKVLEYTEYPYVLDGVNIPTANNNNYYVRCRLHLGGMVSEWSNIAYILSSKDGKYVSTPSVYCGNNQMAVRTPLIKSSTFSSSYTGDTHVSTDYRIVEVDSGKVVFEKMHQTLHKESIYPMGLVLNPHTEYHIMVRHRGRYSVSDWGGVTIITRKERVVIHDVAEIGLSLDLANAVAMNDKIYIVGGTYGAGLRSDNIYVYDRITKDLSVMSGILPAGIIRHAAIQYDDNNIMIAGGEYNGVLSDQCWKIDVSNGTKTQLSSMPQTLAGGYLGRFDTYRFGYIGGGNTTFQATNPYVLVYDKYYDNWYTTEYLTSKTNNQSGAYNDKGDIVSTGGDSADTTYMLTDIIIVRYYTSNGTYHTYSQRLNNLPMPLSQHKSVFIDSNKLLISGGKTITTHYGGARSVLDSLMVLDIYSGEYVMLDTLPRTINAHCMVKLDDRHIAIATGSDKFTNKSNQIYILEVC